ncbi:MAG: imidazole glycerol phosphate synthase subunit HisH [Verrucomicrobiota bacterium JB024]|nr:imidazole glycerol phosphate synthase subunit HisH [Verrucomicrobiota bacterium JB024]
MREQAPIVTVIDPEMGNLRSVCRAWEHAGAQIRLAPTPEGVEESAAVVFPGQGAIPHCMARLEKTGWAQTLKDWIAADKPFFGICLGLQTLFEHSEEGDTRGLGIFPGRVKRFRLGPEYKIPHMGWNAVKFRGDPPPLTDGIDPERDQFYFVHSYHVETDQADLVWGETVYGYPFVSAIAHGKCYATQFHPEKSQAKGLQMYTNFVKSL